MKKTAIVILILFAALAQTGVAQCIEGDCENGYGKYTYTDGDLYEGYWLNGKRHGLGTYVYKEGDMYCGFWKQDEKFYFGAYYWENGDSYAGLWKDNNRMRHGIYTWEDGSSENRTETVNYNETGCVAGDCENGFGVYIWSSGDMHIGFWQNGKQHLLGLKFWEDGDFFYGLYDMGDRKTDRRGYYVFEDGTRKIYTSPVSFNGTGCLAGNCNDGFGAYQWSDGDLHVGFWDQGKQHYLGFKFWEDGDFFYGIYNHGDRRQHKRGLYVWDDGDKSFYTSPVRFDESFKIQEQVASATSTGSSSTGLYSSGGAGTANTGSTSWSGNSTTTTTSDTKIWAVIVGVADYNHINSLRYTDDDAYKLAMFLKSPEGGAIPDDQMRILIDENATRSNIISQLQALARQAGSNDVLLFYFSGHGIDGSFLPSDFDGYYNKLQHSDIREVFASSKAKNKLIIADACHSGSYDKGARSTAVSNTINSYYTALNNSAGGTALMMSSKAEETSIEFQGIRQGIFSHYLIRGLKGEANTNGDKIITISELFDFTSDKVKEYTRYKQTPVLNGNFDRNMPVGVVR